MRNATLTEGEVLAICAYADKGARSSELAFEFGVSAKTIERIKRGERWGNVTGRGTDPRRKGAFIRTLLPEDALAIYNSTDPQILIAREFGVLPSTVSNIKRGYTWAGVTGHTPIRTYAKAGQ